MDKQKQIKEMAKIIDGDCGECYTCKYFESKGINCTCLLSAEYLYNAGYRKIPENAVVLTMEEYEQIYGTVKSYGELLKDLQEAKSVFEKEMEEAQKEFVKQFEEHEKEVRKETAEKFAERLKEWVKEAELGAYVEVESEVINGVIDEIANAVKGVQNGN